MCYLEWCMYVEYFMKLQKNILETIPTPETKQRDASDALFHHDVINNINWKGGLSATVDYKR